MPRVPCRDHPRRPARPGVSGLGGNAIASSFGVGRGSRAQENFLRHLLRKRRGFQPRHVVFEVDVFDLADDDVVRALGGVGGIVVQRRALDVEVEILAFEIVFEVVAARGSVRGSAARADPHAVHLQGRAGGADLGRRAEGFASRAGGTPADLAAVHAARLATSLRVRVRVGEGARVRVLRRAGDAQTAETDVGVGRAGGVPVGGLPLPAPLVSASGPANARVAWGRRDGVRRSRGAV